MPYYEINISRVLELLDLAGDRAGAVQTYNEFSTRLQEDLSVEPSAETRALVDEIRLRIRPNAAPVTLSVPKTRPEAIVEPSAVPAETSFRDRRRWQPTIIAACVTLLLFSGVFVARRWSSAGVSPSSSVVTRVRRERVLIADFDRATADSDLASAVTEAIRLDLSRSPAISVVPWSAVQSVLSRMQQSTVTRLDSSLAREVAIREGVKVVVGGEVRRAGGSFVLAAHITAADSGELIGGWRETARDSSDIVEAIDRLSQSIRNHIGESVHAVRESPHRFRVATASLTALQKHSMAVRAFFSGDYARSAALYEEAVKLDSTFADAWVSLAIALQTMGLEPARQIQAIVKAYGLRDRLPDWERYGVEGAYAYRVRGDLLSAIASYRNQTELEPVDAFWAPIGSMLNQLRRYEESERAMTRANEVSPTPYTFVHLAAAQVGQHKDSAATATIHEGLSRYPRFPGLELARVNRALARGENQRADSLIHAFAARGSDQFPLVAQAMSDALRGNIAEADEHLRALRAAREERGLLVEAIDAALLASRVRLHTVGDTVGAVHMLDSALARHPVATLDVRERPYVRLAHFYVEAHQIDRATALLAEFAAVVPGDYRAGDTWLLLRTRARLRIARGEVAEGVAELRGAERGPPSLATLVELATGYEQLGLPDSALAVYSRYLSAPYLSRLDDDALYLPQVLTRLAVLREQRGDTAGAVAAYQRIMSLWSEADSTMRLKRAVVARRMAALQAASQRK
jgi:tetratricopeptide (TPR) repeat protein